MPSSGHAQALASRNRAWSAPEPKSVQADWSAYATAYDLLSEHNPAYQELLQDFESFLSSIETPRVIFDIGGGTGNYTQIAARKFPNSEIHLVEPDAGMIGVAKSKLPGDANISFENRAFETLDSNGTADLIICVHALYAMPAQKDRLHDLRKLLRPGGLLYLIDLGRYMNVSDWRRYLFSHLKNKHGLIGALRIFWQGREIAKQNTAILKAQKDGSYWTHTEAELEATAAEAGFEILRQQSVYRGYSDLLVCRARL